VAPDDNYSIEAFVTFKDIDNDGNLELLYHKKIVKYRYMPKEKQFKAQPASRKTEIYKLKMIGTQKYILKKIGDVLK
jgi:hypothetical protein